MAHLDATDAASLESFLDFATRFAALSKSQILQDLWVVWELGFERKGIFVDIGAADGTFLSNTYLLERMGWTGLLVEANTNFQEPLRSSRTAPVVHRSVWSETGQTMTLRSVDDFMELSRLDAVRATDALEAKGQRAQFHEQEVVSISLVDLLAQHALPEVINYLSIDIEGSEYEVLKAFDFGRYRFRCITVEHNFTSDRETIHALLKQNGYRRKWTEISAWDDWYVLADGESDRVPDLAKDAYRRLQRVRSQRKEKDQALALSLQFARRWPEETNTVCRTAAVLLKHGSVAEAQALIEPAFTHAPGSASTHDLHSQILEKLGRMEEAVAASARAVALDPAQAKWRLQQASLLLQVGRHQESVDVFRSVVDENPDDASALIGLARACEGLGHGEEAVAFAERATAAAPTDRSAQAQLKRLRRKWSGD